MTNKKKKIVVGLSGGVDSAISLLMLKRDGWSPIGLYLKFDLWKNFSKKKKDDKSLLSIKNFCSKYNISYKVLDVSVEFKKNVVTYYTKELKEGRTPNPCIVCNPKLKFKNLFDFADSLKIENVATGHYANISTINEDNNKVTILKKGLDTIKDQSYSLSFLPQKYLERLILPLGNLKKEDVYKFAKKENLKELSNKEQSQDFCYIPQGQTDLFLKKELKEKKGKIVDENNNILGFHKGLWFYTIGQRKGINLPGGPYYVIKKDTRKNILYVTKDKSSLESINKIILKPVNLFEVLKNIFKQKKIIKIKVKIRSHSQLFPANIKLIDKNKIELKFIKSPPAVTPGQFAVFYKTNTCLGSGCIHELK